MPDHPIRVVIHHPDSGEGRELARRLETLRPVLDIRPFGSPEALAGEHPVVAILRPGPDLSELADIFRAGHGASGPCRLVALIDIEEAERIPTLFQAGFSAFVLPEAEPRELDAAIRSIIRGGIYLARAHATALFSPAGHRQGYIAEIGLTGREQEILRLIAVNMSNKDIARRLQLSVRTVETHRFHIRKKTKAGNWRELAVVAERLGLLGGYDFYSGGTERIVPPGFHED